MPRGTNPLEGRTPDSVVLTKRHMSEAVTYLMRVATDAGLGGIARKLQSVRDSIWRAPPEATDPADVDPSNSPKPN
jgi:hypothetical protein